MAKAQVEQQNAARGDDLSKLPKWARNRIEAAERMAADMVRRCDQLRAVSKVIPLADVAAMLATVSGKLSFAREKHESLSDSLTRRLGMREVPYNPGSGNVTIDMQTEAGRIEERLDEIERVCAHVSHVLGIDHKALQAAVIARPWKSQEIREAIEALQVQQWGGPVPVPDPEAPAKLIALMTAMAGEGFEAWDADQDHRAGKVLLALAGRAPGYRPDLDKARAAVDAAVPAPVAAPALLGADAVSVIADVLAEVFRAGRDIGVIAYEPFFDRIMQAKGVTFTVAAPTFTPSECDYLWNAIEDAHKANGFVPTALLEKLRMLAPALVARDAATDTTSLSPKQALMAAVEDVLALEAAQAADLEEPLQVVRVGGALYLQTVSAEGTTSYKWEDGSIKVNIERASGGFTGFHRADWLSAEEAAEILRRLAIGSPAPAPSDTPAVTAADVLWLIDVLEDPYTKEATSLIERLSRLVPGADGEAARTAAAEIVNGG